MKQLTRDETNRLVNAWHDNPSVPRSSIVDFLGWTWEEYYVWLVTDVPPLMTEDRYDQVKGRLEQYETEECEA